MILPDAHILGLLVEKYLAGTCLTPAERREVIHIAQGFASKDSAAADDRQVETIRSRRKRLYVKLRVCGAGDLLSRLLALSLEMLVRGERLATSAAAPPPVDAEARESHGGTS